LGVQRGTNEFGPLKSYHSIKKGERTERAITRAKVQTPKEKSTIAVKEGRFCDEAREIVNPTQTLWDLFKRQ